MRRRNPEETFQRGNDPRSDQSSRARGSTAQRTTAVIRKYQHAANRLRRTALPMARGEQPCFESEVALSGAGSRVARAGKGEEESVFVRVTYVLNMQTFSGTRRIPTCDASPPCAGAPDRACGKNSLSHTTGRQLYTGNSVRLICSASWLEKTSAGGLCPRRPVAGNRMSQVNVGLYATLSSSLRPSRYTSHCIAQSPHSISNIANEAPCPRATRKWVLASIRASFVDSHSLLEARYPHFWFSGRCTPSSSSALFLI